MEDNCDWGEGRDKEGRSGEGRGREGREKGGGEHMATSTQKLGGPEVRMPHTPEKFFIIRCIRLFLRLFLDQNLLLSLGL